MKTEQIENRAEIKETDTIQEAIKKHNGNINKTFDRAEKGEVINLTDLMIDKEQIGERIEQEQKINQIVEQLNILEAEKLKKEGCLNECFFNSDGSLTDGYKVTSKEKKKYFYIDFGTSGAFMVEKATGNIFNIKSYGQVDIKKCRGNIKDIDIKELHKKRWF